MFDTLMDREIYEILARKIAYATEDRIAVHDSFPSCQNLRYEEIDAMVRTWHRLNLESYDHYGDGALFKELPDFTYDQPPVDSGYFLRCLLHLLGGIDVHTIRAYRQFIWEEIQAIAFLVGLIKEVRHALGR